LVYKERFESVLQASLLKHYKVVVISEDLPNVKEKIELIKRSIAITNRVGEILVDKRPDCVLMSHGIYSTWAPIFQLLDEGNIDILMEIQH